MDARSDRRDELPLREEPRGATGARSPGEVGAAAPPARAFGPTGVAFVHLHAEASEPTAAAVQALLTYPRLAVLDRLDESTLQMLVTMVKALEPTVHAAAAAMM